MIDDKIILVPLRAFIWSSRWRPRPFFIGRSVLNTAARLLLRLSDASRDVLPLVVAIATLLTTPLNFTAFQEMSFLKYVDDITADAHFRLLDTPEYWFDELINNIR